MLSPVSEKTASLTPPSSVSLMSTSSTRQCFFSAYILYIRISSAANNAASSPPAPARISIMAFFSSLGSTGSKRILSSFSVFSLSSRLAASSSKASSLSSLSSSEEIISLRPASSLSILRRRRYASTTGSSEECSLTSLVHSLLSAIISGFDISEASSSYLLNIPSSFSVFILHPMFNFYFAEYNPPCALFYSF